MAQVTVLITLYLKRVTDKVTTFFNLALKMVYSYKQLTNCVIVKEGSTKVYSITLFTPQYVTTARE
jgi:hypothetical protein